MYKARLIALEKKNIMAELKIYWKIKNSPYNFEVSLRLLTASCLIPEFLKT